MANWSLPLELPPPSEGGLAVRIASAVRHEILRGRLRPGQPLPGARSLAQQLGVNRNTVTAAYDALDAEGWLHTEPARGRRVSARGDRARPIRRGQPSRAAMPGRLGFSLGDVPPPSVSSTSAPTFQLGGGLPDTRLIPWELLSRAYRRVLKRHASVLLDYGPVPGWLPLRHQLAAMLADARGLACTSEDVFVTRGSQMGLWLVGAAVLRPGDRVAVESYGYRPAWDALRAHGA